MALTTNLQSSLPTCHLRRTEREFRATFAARNASVTRYRCRVATILSVVRPGRNEIENLAALIEIKSVPAFTGYDLNSLIRLEFEIGHPSRSAK